MLKIEFHTPQRIVQHGLQQECKFVLAYKCGIVGNVMVFDFGDSTGQILSHKVSEITPHTGDKL